MQDNIQELNLCNSYLKKAALFADFELVSEVDFDPNLIVVLPAYNESDLKIPLASLIACGRETIRVQIIVVINHSEDAPTELKKLHAKHLSFCQSLADNISDDNLRLTLILVELPVKHAGVGLARKVGMDQAVRILIRNARPDGVIVNFDADCQADQNYLQEIHRFFLEEPKLDAASIYYEHDMGGAGDNRDAIIHYELHLRYFIQAQIYTGHPYIFHTVGSSMAVRCRSYCAYGGMNKRKAGEDFYFLNKIAKFGRVENLQSTRNLVSARNSDRVPFGTGRAMIQSHSEQSLFKTYSFETFIILKDFFGKVELALNADQPQLSYESICPEPIQLFLTKADWLKKMNEIQVNTKTKIQRIKRFYQWFDPFIIMKFCHYYRDQGHPKIDSDDAAHKLWQIKFGESLTLSAERWLVKYRDWEKGAI